MNIVDLILSENYVDAKKYFQNKINESIKENLELIKDQVFDEINEDNVQRFGREKLIRVRVRKGKIQRRIFKSAVKGFVVRHGHITRMMPSERRHRMLGARKGKIKRRAEIQTILRKRRLSMIKRHNLVQH